MSRIREKNFWFEFVKMYKARPVLWKIKSPIYKQRNLKRHAYQELANKLRRLDPDADVEMVKRKINSIRACFRREMAKIRENRQAIANDEKVAEYKPSWWLFQHLEFLSSQVGGENSSKDDELMEEQEILNAEEGEEGEEERFDSDVQSLSSINEEEFELDETQSSSLQRIDFLDVASSNNQNPKAQQQHVQTDNEAEIYGRGWAIQYKDLSAEQKIYAKKAIEDIFFEAKLGTLQRNSVKINEYSKVERSLRLYND